ncbi:BON1-like protein, partial [Mya arenaria]
ASNETPEQTMSLHDVSENKSAISRYKKAVKQLRISGPTRLKPVISFAESLAVREPTQDSQVYHVLLVITDGILNDIDDILERLTSISQLPLTFVFAGVSLADFKLLARETLAVISSQITENMRRKDIIPNKPSATSLPRSHSSASLINTSQTEGGGLSRRAASRA